MAQEVTSGNAWRKSSLSFANGNCVEVFPCRDGTVFVRNSRDHGQGMLYFTRDEWKAFIAGARLGEFDSLGAEPSPAARFEAGDDGVTVRPGRG